MKTQAEYKQDERKRKKDSGLIQKEIWVYPDEWEVIKKLISEGNKKKIDNVD